METVTSLHDTNLSPQFDGSLGDLLKSGSKEEPTALYWGDMLN